MKYRRALLADVEGYVPGEQPQRSGVVKLNTNENPYPPSPRVLEAIGHLSADAFRKYPDPTALTLRQSAATVYGYPTPDWVFAGNGMDEILALALRTFVDPGDRILAPYPTYTLYETLARLHGATLRWVDLDESFQLPAHFFEEQARLVFVARPNAPTGVAYPRDVMERFCSSFDGLVFIDEAYVDFADDSCIDFPKRFDNVIVGRSFSKSFSMAGLRLGLAFAHPDLIAEFMKTKDSYNVNGVTQAAGIAALQDYGWMETNVARVRATRERLTAGLQKLGFRVTPSQTNFVLAVYPGSPSAREIFESLRARDIFVRYFPTRRLENALRISVGTEDETDILLRALADILGKAFVGD